VLTCCDPQGKLDIARNKDYILSTVRNSSIPIDCSVIYVRPHGVLPFGVAPVLAYRLGAYTSECVDIAVNIGTLNHSLTTCELVKTAVLTRHVTYNQLKRYITNLSFLVSRSPELVEWFLNSRYWYEFRLEYG